MTNNRIELEYFFTSYILNRKVHLKNYALSLLSLVDNGAEL